MAPTPAGRPLRVLQVSHQYHPIVGGSQFLFQRIAEGLVKRGIEVTAFTSTARAASDFIAPAADTLPAGSEEINGVHVRRFAFRQWPRPVRRGLTAVSHLWWSQRWPGYGQLKGIWIGPHLPGFVSSVVKLAPDVIAATATPFLPIYRASTAARRLRVPVAVMPCLHPGDLWMVDNPALMRLLRGVDAVMALTPYEAGLLRGLEVPADRLWVIGGGVDPTQSFSARVGLRQQFNIPATDPVVLFCGRKEEGKGIQQVLEATVRLWKQGRAATLVLAGASTEFSSTHLARLLRRLPDEWKRRLVVRDDIDEAEKWGWYGECDVMAHPSHVESFGLVYLEAWLCGKPVIGGRSGAQCSVIEHGRDGLLVGPSDVNELARQLARLLDDRTFAASLGRAGREKVLRHFTWDAVVDRAEKMYRTLAAAARTHGSH